MKISCTQKLKDLASNGSTTRYQLDDVPCEGVIIQSLVGNTGGVFIGDSGVTNASGAKRGFYLAPGGVSPLLPVSNLNQLYAATETNGNDIVCLCF